MDTLKCRRHPDGSLSGRCRWHEVDAALLALIRLVLDDSWSAQRAAAELRVKVPADTVLRRVRTRVLNALDEHPTPVAQRAAHTLEALLGDSGRTLQAAGSGR